MQEQLDAGQQKLKELNEGYRRKLGELRQKSLKLVSDYSKKADEYEANKILNKLKEGYGK